MVVLAFRYPEWNFRGRLLDAVGHRNLYPPFDLTNVLDDSCRAGPDRSRRVFLKRAKFARNRIENAAVPLSFGQPLFRTGAVAEHRSKAIRGLISVGSGVVGVGQEIELV